MYNNLITRFTLADIARLINSLLNLEKIILNIILLIFIKYLNEDLGLNTSLLLKSSLNIKEVDL